MNVDTVYPPDGPALRDWLAAEECAIERLLDLADKLRPVDPTRAGEVERSARQRGLDLLAVREWLDLRD